LTAILVVRAEQFIVVAAESAVVDETGKSLTPECKIRRVGNIFYSVNKLTQDTYSGYDLHQIVANNDKYGSVHALAAALKTAIPGPLLRSLAALKQRDPATFKAYFATKHVVGIFLAGVDRSRPCLVDLEFNIEDPDSKEIRLIVVERLCPGPQCPGRCTDHPLIVRGSLKRKFEAEHPNCWSGNAEEVAKKAEALIQMVIDEKGSNDVGPPISVLVIRPNGFEWVKRGMCKI